MPSVHPSIIIVGLVMSSVMAKMDQNGFSTNPLINATTEVTPGYTLKGLVMSSVMAQEQTREGDQNRFSTNPQINATTETNQTYKFTAPMDQNQSTQSGMSTTNIAVSSSTSPSGPSPTMPTLGSIFSVRSTAPRLFPTKLPKTNKTTVAPRPQSDDSTGFIIVIVISLAVILLIVACCVTNQKAKMYSVDFSSRQDDVQIPLSTVRPDGPKAQDGVKTFDSVEIDDDEPKVTKDVENVEATVEAKEEEKAVVDSSTDPPDGAPSVASSVNKSNEDSTQDTPATSVEQSPEMKTNEEQSISDDTLTESLKEPNANSSSSAVIEEDPNDTFSNISLNSQV